MKTAELYKKFKECNQEICTDTRHIIPGSLFFALKGANFNGNEFAQKAIDAGAKFAVIDEDKYHTEGTILVKDVLKSLQNLANHHRQQFNIPVIGITGSNGKTTTKELVAAVLQKKYNALVTSGNLNNHLGVPFTLLRLNTDHEIAVIEMGANKRGDIEELCEIAEPTHGIITNIGKSHIEGFGSFEGVIETKTELYDAISSAGGTVFINADDNLLLKNAPSCDLISYGSKGQVKSEITSINPMLNFKWSGGDYKSPEIKSNLTGSYNLPNFTAAICIGLFFDVEETEINQALGDYIPSNNRSQIEKINSCTVIVDCYNANPTSMLGALENFKMMDGQNKLAILGDMKELGDISSEEHQNILDWIKSNEIDAVFIGDEFSKTQGVFNSFKTTDELIQNTGKQFFIENKIVLLKGSRSIKLETLIDNNFFH